MRPLAILPLLVLLACGGGDETRNPATAGSTASVGAPADRDAWWGAATQRAGGVERVLAPRELRALLAAGRAHGFDRDAAWWEPNSTWAYARILALDPDDVEANSAVGRRTLQSIPGFAQQWKRMAEARVHNAAMEEILEQYSVWIDEGRPIFLTGDEYEIAVAKLRNASEHLDRMETDSEYAALQMALERIPSQLHDYPSVHARAGPFLLFLAAPDLSRIEGESEQAEDERVAALRERYTTQLKDYAKVLDALSADIGALYPELAKRHALESDAFFFVWIFSDPGWYRDFIASISRESPERPYRCGFFNAKDMWGYAYLPRRADTTQPAGAEDGASGEPDPDAQLRETLAYIGVQQLLRHWGRDPADRFSNRLDKSRAYWLKEGWPSYLAARRVAKPLVGPALAEGWRFGRAFPELRDVVERESRLELARFQESAPEAEQGATQPVLNLGLQQHFTDLSWLLVQHLNGDARRPAFEQYLLSQIDATRKGNSEGFAQAFELKSDADWLSLEGAVYDAIEGR